MLIQFAVTITVLLAFCGLAIDGGLLALKKTQLQTAADAAAVGASYQSGPAAQTAAARADATLNGFTHGADNTTVTVNSPPATGAYTGNASAVQARVSQAVQPFFFPSSVTLSAQATATNASTYCLYLFSQHLSGTATSLHEINGSINGDCPFYLGLDYAISNGSSTGDLFNVAGAGQLSSGSVTPAPIFNAPPAYDPLSYVPPPAVGACSPVGPALTQNTTLNPGTYCAGLSASNVAVTLNPGDYVIMGHLAVSGGSLSGSGVTIYMTQNSSAQYGTITLTNAPTTLSAPTSGPREGILIFSDRNAPPQQGLKATNGTLTLDGILYMLNQQITSSSNLTCNQYLGIVADSLNLTGGGLTIKSDYSSLSHGNPVHGNSGLAE